MRRVRESNQGTLRNDGLICKSAVVSCDQLGWHQYRRQAKRKRCQTHESVNRGLHDRCRVSDRTRCQGGHPLMGGHRVAFLCEQLGYVSHAPLGLGFNGSLWFCRQLQNSRLLALTQSCQERDLAIGKFQRIVMRCEPCLC